LHLQCTERKSRTYTGTTALQQQHTGGGGRVGGRKEGRQAGGQACLPAAIVICIERFERTSGTKEKKGKRKIFKGNTNDKFKQGGKI
jgi:hypothetical protein